MPTPLAELCAEIRAAGNPEFAAHHARFFKAIPGGYGEGDLFIGCKVPPLRALARKYQDKLGLPQIAQLMASPWHEERLTGLALLVNQANLANKASRANRSNGAGKPGKTGKTNGAATKTPPDFPWQEAFEKGRESAAFAALPQAPGSAGYTDCATLYLACLDGVNNWDLVDLSAKDLLGPAIHAGWPGLLDALMLARRPRLNGPARFPGLWVERVSVLSTWGAFKHNNFAPLLQVAEHFLTHPHDLMHKAVGWLLREAAKQPQGQAFLVDFLDRHAHIMPRTMLRYALEHFPPEQRAVYMAKKSQLGKS